MRRSRVGDGPTRDVFGDLSYGIRSRWYLKWFALALFAGLAATLVWGGVQLGP